MSDRARRSTEDGMGVYDPGPGRAVLGVQRPLPAAGMPTGTVTAPSWEQDATAVGPRSGPAVEQPTPTYIDSSGPIEQATPTELTARPERSEPIRVISMKDHAEGGKPRTEPRVPLHVQLRSIAEVARRHDPPSDLGHLAPPRDPRQARARRRRDNVVWACVAIALACGISLAIWLIAGR